MSDLGREIRNEIDEKRRRENEEVRQRDEAWAERVRQEQQDTQQKRDVQARSDKEILASLLSLLNSLDVSAKLKDVGRHVWQGGSVTQGAGVQEDYYHPMYTGWVSLAYEYRIRYVAFKSSSPGKALDVKQILPAEEDKDWLSYYGRLTAHYAVGKKRTQLFVAAMRPIGSATTYLEVLDGHKHYLLGSSASARPLPTFGMEYRTSFAKTEFDGINRPFIECGEDKAMLMAFLDKWLKAMCLKRARAAELPKELEARAKTIIKKPDRW